MSARRFQDRFVRALLEDKPNLVAYDIVGAGLPPVERLNIYRNNTFITLSQALAQNFPVICRLVGHGFFDQMARVYIRRHPPKSPLLMTYGDSFPRFIEGYDPAKELIYLADVARLEHAWNCCFNGPDGQELDIAHLAEVSPEQFNKLVLDFLPNLALVRSPFPILDIWRINQEAASPSDPISLDQQGQNLAVFRRELEVEIMSVDAAGYGFMEKLMAGMPLGQAAEDVMELHVEFDLQAALQAILQSGILVGFAIKDDG